MHFVFGGAYNGKTAYAKQLEPFAKLHTAHIPKIAHTPLIIRHIEQCITIGDDEIAEAQRIFDALQQLAATQRLIVIGNDISRGVVPLEKEARFQRDCAGRLYQLLTAEATRVTQIWYGIAQHIK